MPTPPSHRENYVKGHLVTDEPTLGEVMRQVKDLVQQVRDLVREVREDYVRKEVYETRHIHINRRIDEVAQDLDDDRKEAREREKARLAFQRQIVAGLIIGTILMIAQLVVTALMVTGR